MIRVLLVDDEPAFTDMLRFFLEREEDISVDGVTSAKEALDKLGSQSYDVILSDFSMPGMDGVEFLKVVRVQGINTPFIMLTGRGREDVAIQALNNGANFYVQKRGDPKAEVVELVSAIRQSVHQREALVEAQSLRQTIEAVVNASPLPIIATDLGGNISLWSKAAERIFGWSAEEVLGRHPPVGCQDMSPELSSLLSEAMGGEEISGVKIGVRDKTGSSIEVTLSLALMRDENGNPIGTVSVLRDIPSIEHIDEGLLKGEDLYRVLAESLKDSVYIISKDNTIQYANKAAAESLSLSLEEVVGLSVDRLPHDSVWNDRAPHLKRAFENGESVHLQDFAGIGGEARWFDTWLIPLKDERRDTIAVMGVSRDITEHKHREETIRAARDDAVSIIDYANVLVVGLDEEGNIRLFNKMVEDISGYSREDVIGKNWRDLIEAGTRYRDLVGLLPKADSSDTRIPRSLVHPILTREGETKWISWQTNELEKDGKPAGVISFGMDITEIDRVRRALTEGDARLRMITQNMKDMITQFDVNDTIQYASPSHRTILGFDPNELTGLHILDVVHPEDRPLIEAYVRRTSETLEPDTVRFRCLKADGSYVWLESTGSLLRDKDGNPMGSVFGSRDVTDRHAIEAALLAANEKLNLLSSLTRHDVDNQMSILLGWLEIARQSIDDDAVLKALDSAQGAARAIGKQMEFASDYQDMGVKKPIWLSPEALCKKALRHLNLGGITVHNKLGGLEVFADPLLEKVFTNLLDNVARHGVRSTRIDIWCEEKDDGLLIVFQDDGVGIPLENKELVFERGFGKNTGLGLYLARAVLEITGMSIRETGNPGAGARFEMNVPSGDYRMVVSDNS